MVWPGVCWSELWLYQCLFNDKRNSHFYERTLYKHTLTPKKVAQQINKKKRAYRLVTKSVSLLFASLFRRRFFSRAVQFWHKARIFLAHTNSTLSNFTHLIVDDQIVQNATIAVAGIKLQPITQVFIWQIKKFIQMYRSEFGNARAGGRACW